MSVRTEEDTRLDEILAIIALLPNRIARLEELDPDLAPLLAKAIDNLDEASITLVQARRLIATREEQR